MVGTRSVTGTPPPDTIDARMKNFLKRINDDIVVKADDFLSPQAEMPQAEMPQLRTEMPHRYIFKEGSKLDISSTDLPPVNKINTIVEPSVVTEWRGLIPDDPVTSVTAYDPDDPTAGGTASMDTKLTDDGLGISEYVQALREAGINVGVMRPHEGHIPKKFLGISPFGEGDPIKGDPIKVYYVDEDDFKKLTATQKKTFNKYLNKYGGKFVLAGKKEESVSFGGGKIKRKKTKKRKSKRKRKSKKR